MVLAMDIINQCVLNTTVPNRVMIGNPNIVQLQWGSPGTRVSKELILIVLLTNFHSFNLLIGPLT